MRVLNRRQGITVLVALILFTTIAIVPPWRYLNGDFAGFAPVFSPPDPLPDSLISEQIAQEYVPIKFIPMGISEVEYKTQFSREEYARPFVDVRKMLAVGAVVFMLTIGVLIALDDRRKRAGEAASGT